MAHQLSQAHCVVTVCRKPWRTGLGDRTQLLVSASQTGTCSISFFHFIWMFLTDLTRYLDRPYDNIICMPWCQVMHCIARCWYIFYYMLSPYTLFHVISSHHHTCVTLSPYTEPRPSSSPGGLEEFSVRLFFVFWFKV